MIGNGENGLKSLVMLIFDVRYCEKFTMSMNKINIQLGSRWVRECG